MNKYSKGENKLIVFAVVILIVFISRIDVVYQSIQLLILFFFQLFSDFKLIKNEFDLDVLDLFFSLIFLSMLFLIAIEIILSIIWRKKLFLNVKEFIDSFNKLSGMLQSGILMVSFLISVSIISPLLSPLNPNFSKDVIVTKLLPPFSKVNYLIYIDRDEDSTKNKIIELKSKIINKEMSQRVIFISNYKIEKGIVSFYQGRRNYSEPIENFETENSNLKVGSVYFILGTDEFGRDLLSRIIYGSRISFLIGILSVLIAFIIGGLIGYTAGFYGGVIDNILMRFVDLFFAIPILFLIILMIALLGKSILILVAALGLAGWMSIARLTRIETISCSKKEFVNSLKLFGQSKFNILIKHIIPNTLSPVIVALVLLLGNVIIAESALSFLGLGVQPPTPSWGGIIKSGYDFISISWWLTIFAGSSIVVTVIAFNMLGEGLKIYLDPRKKIHSND